MEDGVSLNQWNAAAVARKIDAAETAAHFRISRSWVSRLTIIQPPPWT